MLRIHIKKKIDAERRNDYYTDLIKGYKEMKIKQKTNSFKRI